MTAGLLAAAQQARGHGGSAEQQAAWEAQIAALRDAIRGADGEAWTVALEYDLLRLEKRADAVLLTDRAILVLEFKTTDASPAALAEAEDYALDLRDFHAGSRAHPIVPVLVSGGARFAAPAQPPLLWQGVLPPIACAPEELGALLAWVQSTAPPGAPLDGAAWLAAPYRPVPGIVDAATMLYARHGVADIAAARADAANLRGTSDAIARAIAAAKRDHAKTVVFVTGIPGAGKTLCGLNAVFGAAKQDGAAFLSGNAPLIAVLREALARDAVSRGARKPQAEREVKAAIQNVHRFLEDHALDPARVPPERLIVFDEAQRAWDEKKARQGTQNRPGRLTMSEPAHTLEIMGRHEGWAVVVALIGGGQEINTGEAGIAEWGRVIGADPRWGAVAGPGVVDAPDPLRRLADGRPLWLRLDPALDLTVPLRAVRDASVAEWVEAVLANDAARAAAIAAAADEFPVFLTRDLDALRAALRRFARGLRRAGIVRSSGAKRLRGEGLAAEVTADEVPDWFLNRFPDVRASDALEAAATEYACQGLELDVVGVAWGGDLVREAGGWAARRFAGTRWQAERSEAHYVLNTYRVLLTRARAETVIWVPRGSARDDAFHDATRDAEVLDEVAAFLSACGAKALPPSSPATRREALLP
ncbi:MAG: DNA/RNA helicase domain-containing protein [Acetobacteraceae bacterium]